MLPAQNIMHKSIYVVSRQEPDTLTRELIALNEVWELQVRGGKCSIEYIILSILLWHFEEWKEYLLWATDGRQDPGIDQYLV